MRRKSALPQDTGNRSKAWVRWAMARLAVVLLACLTTGCGPGDPPKPTAFQEERDRRQDERIDALEAEIASLRQNNSPGTLRARPVAPLSWGSGQSDPDPVSGEESAGAPVSTSSELEPPIRQYGAQAKPVGTLGGSTRFEWSVELTNPSDRARTANLTPQLLDREGQVIASGSVSVTLEPNETRRVTGTQLVGIVAAMHVARFVVEIE